MLITSLLKSLLVYLYYLKKIFYENDTLIKQPCSLENINFQLINTQNDQQQYQNFPLFIARPEYSFTNSVASGDPSPFSLIFWTKITPKNKVAKSSLIPVYFQLSKDESFNEIILSGVTYTNSLIDFTVKLHIRDLSPNTIYYYKFNEEKGLINSEIGKSRTLPNNYDDLGFIDSIDEDHNDNPIHLSITDSYKFKPNFTSPPDFILQLNDYQNKIFTRLKDYRFRYSKELKQSNITTLYGSNLQMYSNPINYQLNDYTRALLEWFPMKPPKVKIIGKSFQIGDYLSIKIIDNSMSSIDKESNTHQLIYNKTNSGILELLSPSNNQSNLTFLNLRDYKNSISLELHKQNIIQL